MARKSVEQEERAELLLIPNLQSKSPLCCSSVRPRAIRALHEVPDEERPRDIKECKVAFNPPPDEFVPIHHQVKSGQISYIRMFRNGSNFVCIDPYWWWSIPKIGSILH